MEDIIITTDKNQLNIKFIHEFLTHSYWAKGRTIDQVKKCIENSLNFTVILNGKQVGYGRVVTDYTIFAYLLDVFIIEEERGKGLSKKLMEYILNHPDLKGIENWKLATLDAHGLYQKFGFVIPENPEKIMEKLVK